MKTYPLLLLILIAACTAQAQVETPTLGEPPSDSLTDQNFVDLAEYLPPLSILIDSAIANSEEVEVMDIQVKMREYEVSQNKKDWADLVSFSASYRYSDIGVALTEEGVPLQSSKSTGYVVGAGVRIPLSYFTDRKDKMQASKLNVELVENQKKSAEKAVREKVIQTYNQLLLLQRLIAISTEAKEFSDLIFQMSEERFRDGDLSLDQMGSNTGLKAKYSAEYEQLKTDFNNTYSALERLVGVPLSKLQK